MSTAALMTYAMPRRQIFITGRNMSSIYHISNQEAESTKVAASYDPGGRSSSQVMADLNTWSPVVRLRASEELGRRRSEHASLASTLRSRLLSRTGQERLGVCLALGRVNGVNSASQIAAFLNHSEMRLRWMAAESLRYQSTSSQLTALNTMLDRAIQTRRNPLPLSQVNPLRLDQARYSLLLFYRGGASGVPSVLWKNGGLSGVDKNRVYRAMNAVSTSPMGHARNTLGDLYDRMTKVEVQGAAESVVRLVEEAAPGDIMFGKSARIDGLAALERHNFAEGVPLVKVVVDDLRATDTWGRGLKIADHLKFLRDYAGSSNTVNPDPNIVSYCDEIIANVAQNALIAVADQDMARAVKQAISSDTNPAVATPFKRISSLTASPSNLTLPSNQSTLRVVASDDANGASRFRWRRLSGPGSVSFSPNNSSSTTTTATFGDVAGTYRIEVTMSDSRGLTEVSRVVNVVVGGGGGGGVGEVEVIDVTEGTGQGGSGDKVLEAGFRSNGASKLVVVLGAEHGWPGNTGGEFRSVTYGGVAMTEAIQEGGGVPTAAIFYLDNPGVQGDVVVDQGNHNGTCYAIYRLRGTLPGVGASRKSTSHAVSLTTTRAKSLVIAGVLNAGPNGGNLAPDMRANSPLIEDTDTDLFVGSRWTSLSAGSAEIATASSRTYSFAGRGSSDLLASVVVEIRAADGEGAGERKNWARESGASANQSNTGFGGSASRAIDGNTSGLWSSGTITHTSGASPSWWQVNLGADRPIDEIVMHNRTDGNLGQRLSNFRVTIFNRFGVIVLRREFYRTSGFVADQEKWSFNEVVGRTVRIEKLGLGRLNSRYLSLAEVQVFGGGAVANLSGLTEADARDAIAEAGLSVGSVSRQFSDSVIAGRVISYVVSGSRVNLVISQGVEGSPKLVQLRVRNVSSSTWQTVLMGESYDRAIIVATPIIEDARNIPPVVTRIRNVQSGQFALKLSRTDGGTGTVFADVSVIIVEEGVYTQESGGVKMEAFKVDSTVVANKTSWLGQRVDYENSYANPVVLGQVMTTRDARWSSFWAYGSTRTSPPNSSNLHVGMHVGEDSVRTRTQEMIGYIVIESGSGVIGNLRYSAGVGADVVVGVANSVTPINYPLSGLSSADAAVVSSAGMDGADGGWPVLAGTSPMTGSRLGLYILEDEMSDDERSHTHEQVAYFVVGRNQTSNSSRDLLPVSQIEITSLKYLGDDQWEVVLKGAPFTTYRLVSSPDLTFSSPVLLKGLVGEKQGAVTGEGQSEIITDESGSAKVTVVLDRSNQMFLSAEVAD